MRLRMLVTVAVAIMLAGTVGFTQGKSRTEQYVIGPYSMTGAEIGNCGSFKILNDYVFQINGTIVYDKSGAVKQDGFHYRLLGESVYYNSEDPDKAVAGSPAERENDKFRDGLYIASGPSYKVRIPGYGLIFAETGHLIYDLNTQQFLFNAGHNQFIDKDLAALCNYLK